MKLFVAAVFLVAAASAASLDNTYLPPGSARTAGGNGNFLGAPQQSGSHGFGGGQADYRSNSGGHSGSASQDIPILKFNNENNGDGNYQFEYETGNGIQAQEAGQLKNAGSDQESIEVQGSYSFTGDDGQQYTVTYIADENGFQAQGAHLPTPPPIPEAILRSLEQNAAEEASGRSDDGQYNEGAHNQGAHNQGAYNQGGHNQGHQQHSSNAGYKY